MGELERRLRDYAANGCRSWAGIEAVFIEAADALKAKDAALAPFAAAATAAEFFGDYAYVYIANAITLSECQVARATQSIERPHDER